MTYSIRLATEADISAIENVLRTAFSSKEGEDCIQELKEWRETNKDITSLVALDNDTVIGHVSVLVKRPSKTTATAYFAHLAIASEHRRQGIAGQLLGRIAEFIDKQKEPIVGFASATTANPYSQQTLLSHGFAPMRIAFIESLDYAAHIGFLRLFYPTPFPSAELHLGAADSYEETFLRAALGCLEDTHHTTLPLRIIRNENEPTSNRLEQWLTIPDEKRIQGEKVYPIRLAEKCAVTEIERLTQEGYYANGIFVRPMEGITNVSLQFMKLPPNGLSREGIHIISAAQPLFNLVWNEYSKRRGM